MDIADRTRGGGVANEAKRVALPARRNYNGVIQVTFVAVISLVTLASRAATAAASLST